MDLFDKQIFEDQKEKDLPLNFIKNKRKWCSLLVKSPTIQQFHHQFSDRLHELVSSEIQKNKEIFNMYKSIPTQPIQNANLSPIKSIASKTETQKFDKIKFKEFEDIYYKHQNVDQKKQIDDRVNKELKQAKYNYKKQLREQRKNQMKLTGSLKHLNKKSLSPSKVYQQQSNEEIIQNNESSLKSSSDSSSAKSFHLDIKEIEKLKQDKYKKLLLNEFQLQVFEKAQSLDNLVKSIDENNKELMKEVNNVTADLENIQAEKNKKGMSQKIPGEAIQRLMDMWSQEPVMYDEQLARLSAEPWVSLHQIEKKIMYEERGYKIEFRNNQQRFNNIITFTRTMNMLRQEANESALIETKMKYMTKIEQMNMEQAERESKLMNQVLEPKHVESVMQQIEQGIRFKNVQEAKSFIDQLVRIVKSKETEIELLQNEAKENKKLIDSSNDRISHRELQYLEQQRLRLYYQRILMKMARDLRLFISNPEKQRKFDSLNEMDDDLIYQRQVLAVLQNLQFQSAINDHVNKYYAQNQGILKIEDNFKIMDNIDIFNYDYDDLMDTKQNETKIEIQEPNQIQKGKKANTKKSKAKQQMVEQQMQNESDNEQDEQNTNKGKLKNLKQTIKTLLDQIIMGQSEQIATETSGQFDKKKEKNYRKNILEVINEVDPSLIEDFRLKYANKMEVVQKNEFDEINQPAETQQKPQKTKNKVTQQKPLTVSKEKQKPVIKKQEVQPDILQVDQSDQIEQKISEKQESPVPILKKQSQKTQKIQKRDKVEKQLSKKKVMISEVSESSEEDIIKDDFQKTVLSLKLTPEAKSEQKDSESEETISEKDFRISKKKVTKQFSKQKIKQKKPQRKESTVSAFHQKQIELSEYASSKSSSSIEFDDNVSVAKLKETHQNNLQFKFKNSKKKKSHNLKTKKGITTNEENNEYQDQFQLKNFNDKHDNQNEQGANVISNKLNKYVNQRLSALELSQQNSIEENLKQFTMNAQQLVLCQEVTQVAMDEDFHYDYLMNEFYQSHIEVFFSVLNKKIVGKYLHLVQEKKNIVEEENQKKDDDQMKKLNLNMGDLIVCKYSDEGEIIGFELRHNLVRLMFMNNNYDQKILHRIIKAVCFLNRIVIHGQDEDFALLQRSDPNNTLTKMKKVNVEIQVDEEELMKNVDQFHLSDSSSFHKEYLTPRTTLLNVLKHHLYQVMSRNNAESKQALNKLVISEMNAEQIMNYEMENVYVNEQFFLNKEQVTFENYLHCIFHKLIEIINYLPREQSMNLFIDEIYNHGKDQKDKIKKQNQEVQACVIYKNKEVLAVAAKRHITSNTGTDLLTAYLGEKGNLIIKKSELQFNLDVELEKEFQKTLKMMDEFASQVYNLEYEQSKIIHKQNKRQKELLELKSIVEQGYEEQEQLNAMRREKHRLEDQLENIETLIKQKKDQNKKKIELKQEQLDQPDPDNKLSQKVYQIKKFQQQMEQSNKTLEDPQTLENQVNFIRNNPDLMRKYLQELNLMSDPNLENNFQQKIKQIFQLQIQHKQMDNTLIDLLANIQKQQQNKSSTGKDLIDELNTDNIFSKKDWVVKMPKDVKKTEFVGEISELAQEHIDERLKRHKKFNEYLKKKLKLIANMKEEQQKIYEEKLKINFSTSKIQTSQGQYSSHFSNQPMKITSPNVLKNIYQSSAKLMQDNPSPISNRDRSQEQQFMFQTRNQDINKCFSGPTTPGLNKNLKVDSQQIFENIMINSMSRKTILPNEGQSESAKQSPIFQKTVKMDDSIQQLYRSYTKSINLPQINSKFQDSKRTLNNTDSISFDKNQPNLQNVNSAFVNQIHSTINPVLSNQIKQNAQNLIVSNSNLPDQILKKVLIKKNIKARQNNNYSSMDLKPKILNALSPKVDSGFITNFEFGINQSKDEQVDTSKQSFDKYPNQFISTQDSGFKYAISTLNHYPKIKDIDHSNHSVLGKSRIQKQNKLFVQQKDLQITSPTNYIQESDENSNNFSPIQNLKVYSNKNSMLKVQIDNADYPMQINMEDYQAQKQSIQFQNRKIIHSKIKIPKKIIVSKELSGWNEFTDIIDKK